jgi:hypothetical protein
VFFEKQGVVKLTDFGKNELDINEKKISLYLIKVFPINFHLVKNYSRVVDLLHIQRQKYYLVIRMMHQRLVSDKKDM